MPRHGIRRRRGQSTVEFGVSAIVLIRVLPQGISGRFFRRSL